MHHRLFAAAVLLAIVGVASGCARKFTHDRFLMIQEAVDDRHDVRQILGSAEFEATDEWYYEDIERHIAARVFFDADGRVRGKEWMDAKTGTWEGRHPDTDQPAQGEVRETHTKTRRHDD
ncbi:MAG: hypothetical protein KKB50_13235 [Planctomycetes bacterium]|nr:hypothetical protein [Planctomycetota bacterium]